MLTSLEVFLYGFVAVFLLPLAIWSLATGSKPPSNGFLSRFYEAQPGLMVASNVFLITLCAFAIHGLARHFGYLDAATADAAEPWILGSFVIMLLVFVGLFVRAILKVRRETGAAA